MGTCTSQYSSISAEHKYVRIENFIDRTIWRQQDSYEEALWRYFRRRPRDTLSFRPAQVEFRALLNDGFAIDFISQYAMEIQKMYLIACWNDIQVYKNTPNSTTMFDKLSMLVDQYGKIPGQEYENNLLQANDASRVVTRVVTEKSWQHLELQMFDLMYTALFTPFMWTKAFPTMCAEIKQTYNCVSDDDFEYYEKICEGAYGLVMHVKKKSTNVHYAMKVQGKALLLHHLQEDPMRILQEMQTLVSFNHPFIMHLLYAFQTTILAVMVMPLCIYGDLGILILNSPQRRLPLPDVMFYTAEILSALQYLHKFGIMYRDLKPGNVLLAGDGHCLLADFGAAIDTEGNIADNDLARSGVFRYYSPLYSADHSHSDHDYLCLDERSSFRPVYKTSFSLDVNSLKEDLSYAEKPQKKMRAKSIVGTVAYMAPEIIFKFGSRTEADKTYTNAVDYWSLGITVYTMVYGKLPFRHVRVEKLQQYLVQVMARPNAVHKQIFDKVFGSVTYSGVDDRGSVSFDHSGGSSDSVGMQCMIDNKALVASFITTLLQFEPSRRDSATLSGAPSRPAATDENGEGTPTDENGEGTPTAGVWSTNKQGVGLRGHPFFKNIDWNILEAKELRPPEIHTKIKALAAQKYEGKGLPNEADFVDKSTFRSPAKPKTTIYTMEDILVRNGRNKWLLGCEHSAPCSALSASENCSSSGSSSHLYAGSIDPLAAQGPMVPLAEAPMTDDSAAFYRISATQQQMFAHWYYVAPSIIDIECQAQRHSRIEDSNTNMM